MRLLLSYRTLAVVLFLLGAALVTRAVAKWPQYEDDCTRGISDCPDKGLVSYWKTGHPFEIVVSAVLWFFGAFVLWALFEAARRVLVRDPDPES